MMTPTPKPKTKKKLVILERAENVAKDPDAFIDAFAAKVVASIQAQRKRQGLPPLPKK